VNKTLIVDGNSLLKLGFHGLKNFQNQTKHLGGVFFFLNTIRKSIAEDFFSKIIVAWDGERNYEYRRKIYAPYKSKRRAEYPSIADQLDDIYHNGVDAWKATIKATKDKYTK